VKSQRSGGWKPLSDVRFEDLAHLVADLGVEFVFAPVFVASHKALLVRVALDTTGSVWPTAKQTVARESAVVVELLGDGMAQSIFGSVH